ncbi:unnamed protein product [Danaus chrysippus]|uniref:(African queen) hypothetical protein n=1 Tax=Danaus chrysippus TaxID=151541 RepID=A0A8J2QXC0_9NEOP|nr:unnamed protein product [Danaus chrysippus]
MDERHNSNLKALQAEVEFHRQNQTLVDQEIKNLIADNQKLSQQVGVLLKEKLQFAQQSLDNDQREELEELKKQVNLLTKERDSLHVLWQTSQKTIDALDVELKAYQNYDDGHGKQNSNDKRDLEYKLDTALSDYVELETKYKKIHSELNHVEKELKDKEKDIIHYKEKCNALEIEVDNLKKSLDEYKISLTTERKSRDDIKEQLLLSQKECVDKIKKEAEAKTKVAEALQLFDVVTTQKNEAYKKIAEITEELNSLKQTICHIERKAEANYRKELDELKQNYNEKVSDMLQHIRNLDAELVEKGLLLNKTMRENKVLQTSNENYMKQQQNDMSSVDPKLALAEQRLEAMFQELVCSERRNIQVVCEKQCLVLDIQRIQDVHTRERKRWEWEENLMKTQIEELKLQVDHLQKSLNESHEMITKLQSMLSSRTELNQKMVSTKEEELMELNKHLENQMELNKKWKESYIDMTEKLKQRLCSLQRENKELKLQLNIPQISSPSMSDGS